MLMSAMMTMVMPANKKISMVKYFKIDKKQNILFKLFIIVWLEINYKTGILTDIKIK